MNQFILLCKHKTLMLLRRIGIRLISKELILALDKSGLEKIVKRWSQEEIPRELADFIYANFQESRSQLQQDLIALYIANRTHYSKTGFFVEFGATDGVTLSNSYLLETKKWNGILVEPDQRWHSSLIENRCASIVTKCVFSSSNKMIKFMESTVGELSGILEFAQNDGWGEVRRDGLVREVETVSLEDLLTENNAPNHINFLSIDTEGSEYEIIRDFNFKNWRIDFVAIEHNFTYSKESILRKMQQSGYKQILPVISAWDSWFLREELIGLCDFKITN